MIRNLVLGVVGAVALSVSANAADIYRAEGGLKDGPVYAPVASWTGFYAGVNGGYAWSSDKLPLINLEPEGGFGGGQIGYNIQRNQFVFGVEADFQGADIEDKSRFRVGNVLANFKTSLDWFGTVRGRVGVTFDRTLIYATGGFAYGQITDEVSVAFARQGVSVSGKEESTKTGYVVGGGIEHKFNPSWSLKGEYQYINLDNDDRGFAGALDKDHEFHTARVGLNYHFGQTYEPLK